MTGKVFVDTNIWIHTFDVSNAKKRDIARQLIRNPKSDVVLSTQILLEYFRVMTQKLGQDPVVVRQQMNDLTRFEVVSTTPDLVLTGASIAILNQISIWDAMIVCAAKFAQCSLLITEDLKHGQVIDGVRIHNPYL